MLGFRVLPGQVEQPFIKVYVLPAQAVRLVRAHPLVEGEQVAVAVDDGKRQEPVIKSLELLRFDAGGPRLDLRPQIRVGDHLDRIAGYILRVQYHPVIDDCLEHLESVAGGTLTG